MVDQNSDYRICTRYLGQGEQRIWLVKCQNAAYRALDRSHKNGRVASNTAALLIKSIGPLARIGPTHLLTDDPELVRRMLAPRTKYTRGPWFDCFTIDPDESNIASERDQGKHNTLRSQVAPGVGGHCLWLSTEHLTAADKHR